MKFKLSRSYFHHHAEPILSTHSFNEKPLEDCFREALSGSSHVPETVRTEKGVKRGGVKAGDVNDAIRQHLASTFGRSLSLEVKEREGYWEWGLKKEGFDFAILDHSANLIMLRNTCLGRRPISSGSSVWEAEIRANTHYQELMESMSDELSLLRVGEDVPIPKSCSLPILGEIQLGNHALRGVDMFRLMRAQRSSEVGIVVYITATGNLESLLSSGIVTFDVMKEFLKEFDKEIPVPIWLIGVDAS